MSILMEEEEVVFIVFACGRLLQLRGGAGRLRAVSGLRSPVTHLRVASPVLQSLRGAGVWDAGWGASWGSCWRQLGRLAGPGCLLGCLHLPGGAGWGLSASPRPVCSLTQPPLFISQRPRPNY